MRIYAKSEAVGQVVSLVVKMLEKIPVPHIGQPWDSLPALAPDSVYLLRRALGGNSSGSSNWIPANHVEDLDWVPSSWL